MEESRSRFIVKLLKEEFNNRLIGIILFGSRARGDFREESDYDILVVLDKCKDGDKENAYICLRPFRSLVDKDTTVLVISYKKLIENIGFSTILNAMYEGKILYDYNGKIKRIKKKLIRKLREVGIVRIKEKWGYTWITPKNTPIPFTLSIDEDPIREFEFRLRLAKDHLETAERSFNIGLYPVAVHYAQLSIENSTKAIIALFKPPTWSHRPGGELLKLIEERKELKKYKNFLEELSRVVDEVSKHHGLTTYGDIESLKTPKEIYTREEAKKLVLKAKEILQKTRQIINDLSIRRYTPARAHKERPYGRE